MFSQTFVILFIGGGGDTLGRHLPRQTLPPGRHPLSSACLDTYTPTAQCMLGYDEHCSGRYASYWNAFLFPCKLSYKNVKSNHSPRKWRGGKRSQSWLFSDSISLLFSNPDWIVEFTCIFAVQFVWTHHACIDFMVADHWFLIT